VAFEVMICYNARPYCARKLVKTSSNSEESNASFEVCWAYLQCHCDVLSWKNPFYTLPKNCIQKAVVRKLNTLDMEFLH